MSGKWADLTEIEIRNIKLKQCLKCYYFTKRSEKGSVTVDDICDYAGVTGKCRHCSPLECKEKGFFEPKRGRKRKPRTTCDYC